MAERNERTEALILRSRESPRGDRIVSMLSPDLGILDAFVFGGPKSSLRAIATPYVYADVFLYCDPVRHYRKLNDMTIRDAFPSLRGSYSRLRGAAAMAEFTLRTSGCGGEYPQVLAFTIQALHALETADDDMAGTLLSAWLWKSIALMGLMPDTERCANCGKTLRDPAPSSGAGYSPSLEAFACGGCAPDILPAPPSAFRTLSSFGTLGFADLAKLGSPREGIGSLDAIITFLAGKAAEGPLRSLEM